MAQYTTNENLYKWSASDTKQTTITETALNADKIDAKLNDHTAQLAETAKVLNPLSFGAVGDGVTDDTNAFISIFAYIASIAKDVNLSFNQKGANNIVVDLSGKKYLIKESLILGKNVGYFKICNGSFVFAPTVINTYDENDHTTYKNMNALFMIEPPISGHTGRIAFDSVIFHGDYCAIRFTESLNCLVTRCSFLNCRIGVLVDTDHQSHEIIVSQCEFRSGISHAGIVAFMFRDDCLFLDNIVENYKIGGIIKGLNNVVSNNHLWSIDKYAVKVLEGSLYNQITNNYFDGCCVALEGGGLNTTISNNLFFANRWYAQVYLLPTNSAALYELYCVDNMMATTGGYAPELYISNLSLNNSVLTSLTPVFNEKMVGAYIIDLGKYSGGEYTNVAYITEVIDLFNVRLKAVKGTASVAGFTDTALTYNITVKPTDVMLFSKDFTINSSSYGQLVVKNTKMGSCELSPVSGYEVAKYNIDKSITFDARLTNYINSLITNPSIKGYQTASELNSIKSTSLTASSSLGDIINTLSTGEKLTNFYVENISYYPSSYGKLTTNKKDNGMTIFYQQMSNGNKLYRADFANGLLANINSVTWLEV